MSAELKPCPFCGDAAVEDRTYEVSVYYGCNRCHVWLFPNEWNCRATESEQAEADKWAQAARDAEVAELRTKLEEAERKLGDLLARIHRDGGHYTGQHGMEKSVEDAHTIVATLFADKRTLPVRLENSAGGEMTQDLKGDYPLFDLLASRG